MWGCEELEMGRKCDNVIAGWIVGGTEADWITEK